MRRRLYGERERERGGAWRRSDRKWRGIAVYVMGAQRIQTSQRIFWIATVLGNKRMKALCSFKTLRLLLWFFFFFVFLFIEGDVGQDFRVNRPKHFVAWQVLPPEKIEYMCQHQRQLDSAMFFFFFFEKVDRAMLSIPIR